MRLFKNFATGSDFNLQGYLTEVLSSEDKKKARATNKLLVVAMEQSGFGPKVGTMNLHKKEGEFAFLRAAKSFFPNSSPGKSQDFERTIPSIQQMWKQSNELTNISTQDVQAMFNKINKTVSARAENQCSVARAQMNPIILFLCLDHGVDSATQYTPMASPLANGRSLVTKHLNAVCKSVVTSEGSSIIASEDISIAPYCVLYDAEDLDAEGTIKGNATENTAGVCSEKDVLHAKGNLKGTDTDEEEGPKQKDSPIHYKCILNRDRYSHKGDVWGRTAVSLTADHLIKVYEVVSLSMVHTRHTVGSCRACGNPSHRATFFPTAFWTDFTHGSTGQLEGQTNERAYSRILPVL